MTNKKSSLSKKLNNKSSKKPRVDKPSSLPQKEGRYDGGGNSGDFSDDLYVVSRRARSSIRKGFIPEGCCGSSSSHQPPKKGG